MSASGNGVAVIVAAFNAEASIRRAVASALAQGPVSNVIVVDDGSHDGTAAAARSVDDGSGRLQIVALAQNAGPARARNIALDTVQSPYVCVLDADDFFLPGRVERLLHAGAGAPWDMLADDIVILPDEPDAMALAELESTTAPGDAITLDLVAFVKGDTPAPGESARGLGFLKPILSRRFMQQHGLRYEESMRLGEDYALYVRALMVGARFHLVGACGYVAVERPGSISSHHSAEDLARFAAFDARCLASEAGLDAAQRRAMMAHHRSTLRRLRYRRVLDCNRERGLLPALGMLVSGPEHLPYIFRETVRAKVSAYRVVRNAGGARHTPRAARLLIGLPVAGLSLEHAGFASSRGEEADRAPQPRDANGSVATFL